MRFRGARGVDWFFVACLRCQNGFSFVMRSRTGLCEKCGGAGGYGIGNSRHQKYFTDSITHDKSMGCKLLEPGAEASVLDTVDRVLTGANQVVKIAPRTAEKCSTDEREVPKWEQLR